MGIVIIFRQEVGQFYLGENRVGQFYVGTHGAGHIHVGEVGHLVIGVDSCAKYNHIPFLALPLLSDWLLSRNLSVSVLSAESGDLLGFGETIFGHTSKVGIDSALQLRGSE